MLRTAKELGYTVVSDTCAAKDYTKKNSDFIARRTLARVENGSIILLHDEYATTGEALPRIIKSLRSEGYRFVTVSQMLQHLPPATTANRR